MARRDKTIEARLVKLYGITVAERDAMSLDQGDACKICRTTFKAARSMHVDHCHTTGKVRGLLCSRCNQAIGLLQDDPEILREAARYIENAA